MFRIHTSNRFFLDTLKLGAGTSIGQVLVALSAPILSRLYLPEAFGAFAVFNSVVLTFSMISGFRYELAILLPQDDHDAFDLLTLQLALNLLFAVIVGLLIGIFSDTIATSLGQPDIANLLWLAGVGIFLFGSFNGINYWNSRFRRYRMLGMARIINSMVTTLTQVVAALSLFAGAGGLIFGLLIGKTAENGLQLLTMSRGDRHFTGRQGRWASIKALMCKYRKFPQYNTWATLLNTLAWQTPALFLTALFGLEIAGFYAIGERVIRLPMNVVGRAIAQVFFQQGAEAHRAGKMHDIYCQTLRMLSVLGLMPTLILSLAGRDLFSVILGSQWAEAGLYVQILALWAFVWFLASPLSTIISITEKQEKSLLFNILILGTRLISLIIGGVLHSPRLALILFSVTGILSYGWLLIWTGQESGVSVKKTVVLIFSTDWRWAIATMVVLVSLLLISASSIWVCVSAVILMGGYGLSIGRRLKPMLRFGRP
ncbi:oligosaccharide flippase family protein [candidate division KSB1 bacterium]|nr:oligosaccharide flippase family protein [candidate division KSB1 bacterium]